MSIFCKHKWKVLSETTTKSRYEHAVDMGLSGDVDRSFMLDRKMISIIACEKCGKLKRFVERL